MAGDPEIGPVHSPRSVRHPQFRAAALVYLRAHLRTQRQVVTWSSRTLHSAISCSRFRNQARTGDANVHTTSHSTHVLIGTARSVQPNAGDQLFSDARTNWY